MSALADLHPVATWAILCGTFTLLVAGASALAEWLEGRVQ